MSAIVVREGSPQHRRYQIIGWGVTILVLVLLPFVFDRAWDPVIFDKKFTIGMDNLLQGVSLIVAVLGLNLLVGFNGQISLGNSFFIGSGAYISGVLVVDHGWPILATLVVVIPVCFLFGVLVGIPALKIKGLYLALITVVLAAIFPTMIRLEALENITRASNGLNVSSKYNPPTWLPLTGIAEFLQGIPLIGGMFGSDGISSREAEQVWKYVIVVGIAVVLFWVAANLIGSRVGRAWIAIRDNQTGAAVSGVDVRRYKTLAFGVSAAYAGVAGTMIAIAIGALAPDSFSVNLAIFLIVGLVVGGNATLSGAVVGGLFIIFIPLWTSQWASQTDSFGPFDVTGDRPYGTVLLGLFLIAITFVLPGGFVAGLRKLRARLVRIEPAPIGPVRKPVHDPREVAEVTSVDVGLDISPPNAVATHGTNESITTERSDSEGVSRS